MRIERLKVYQFGRFSEYEIRFRPGLNIIKGPNEAGKSTLHRAIMMALLSQASQTKPNERYRVWGSQEWFRLELEFYNSSDGPYRLLKDFNIRTQELVHPKGTSFKTLDKIQAFLDSTVGTSSSSIFESTVCVAQDELADLSRGQKEISHNLEGIITGGKDNLYAQDAIKKLNAKITEYSRGVIRLAPTNPGPIARLTEEKSRLERIVNSNIVNLKTREEFEQELTKIRARLDKVELELNDKKTIKATVDKVNTLNDQLEILHQREDNLDEKVNLINQANDEKASAIKILNSIKPTARLTPESLNEIKTLHSAIRNQTTSPSSRLHSYNLPVLILIFALITGGAGVYFRSTITLFAILIVLCLGLLGFGIYLLITIKKQTDLSEGSDNLLSTQDGDLQELSMQLQVKLKAAGFSTYEELNMMLERVSNARSTLENAQQRIEILMADRKSVEDIKAERKKTSGDIRRIQEQLEDPKYKLGAQMSLEQYQELEKSLSELEQEREKLKERQQYINGHLAQAIVSREKMLQAEEELKSVDIELRQAQERLEVYKLALKMMQEAREATLSRASDEIAPRLGRYFSSLTLDRYDGVVVDSELNIRIKHPSKPDFFIEPKSLSQGTQDQLYLAARLALVDLLFGDANPPMFLDDPFVKFDPSRLHAAITLCQKIAAKKQVLLFTCSNNYDHTGHVITLPDLANLKF